MHKRRRRLSTLTVIMILFSVQAGFAQQKLPSPAEREVTWEDAPPIARVLQFTLQEAKSLFYYQQQPYVDYYPDRTLLAPRTVGGRTQQNGKPLVTGQWALEPRPSAAIDKKYRVGTGIAGNPANLYVHSVYRFAPPESKEERAKRNPDRPPTSRLDLKVISYGNTHMANAELIDRDKKAVSERYAKLVQGDSRYYDYDYVDLGFGLMQNDMLVYLNKNGASCQVEVYLTDEKHFARVWITLLMHGEAVSQREAVEIARGAAIIMSNKIWNTNIRPPGIGKGVIGISDIWLTDQPGETPEGDRHQNQVMVGGKIDLVIVHQPPPGDKEVWINVWFRPGQDAVAASITRTRRRLQELGPDAHFMDPYKEQLDPTEIDGIPAAVKYDEQGKRSGYGVKFKTLPHGSTVAYVPIHTDDIRGFIKGPGNWEIEVEMEQIVKRNLEGEHETLQLSTAKTNIFIQDNPAEARKMHYLD